MNEHDVLYVDNIDIEIAKVLEKNPVATLSLGVGTRAVQNRTLRANE